MKKLRRFNLASSSQILDIDTMVNITGGDTGEYTTSCSTMCKSGIILKITECIGTCVADPGEYVACIGETQELRKTCM